MEELDVTDYNSLYPSRYELNRREYELIYWIRKELKNLYNKGHYYPVKVDSCVYIYLIDIIYD